jgi:hypothetical protein
VANDGDLWGKTTAWLRGLSKREESTSGGQSRRLASDECSGNLHQGGGKVAEKGKLWPPCAFIARGERGW